MDVSRFKSLQERMDYIHGSSSETVNEKIDRVTDVLARTAGRESQVPDHIELQYKSNAGVYGKPEFSRCIEDYMHYSPDRYQGHQVFKAGYQKFSQPTAFSIRQQLMGMMGKYAEVMVQMYDMANFELDESFSSQTSGKQYANHLKRMATARNKPISSVVKEWIVVNHSTLNESVVFHTLEALDLLVKQQQVNQHNYNWNGICDKTRVSTPFGNYM
ncbi:hypothetical protein N8654_04350 [Synechococcus sp. AH-601-B19]|nr:hypothetical protein [Synechococcus sp. AH-601-B19]